MVFLVLLDWLTGYTAQEILPNCRQLIIDHMQWCNNTTEMSHPMPCVFGDMTEVLPPDTFTEGNFMKKVYRANKMPMMTHQHCYTHKQVLPFGGARRSGQWLRPLRFAMSRHVACGLAIGARGPHQQGFYKPCKTAYCKTDTSSHHWKRSRDLFLQSLHILSLFPKSLPVE